MAYDFLHRPRRLRMNACVRDMERETHLRVDDLVYPMFVTETRGAETPISSMPGCCQYGVDRIAEACKPLADLGIPAVILFGIPKRKDEWGSQAHHPHGVIPQAIEAIKRAAPNLVVITDVCLCEYTSHGHCGLLEGERILNDETVEVLSQEAVAHARAGADIVAPRIFFTLERNTPARIHGRYEIAEGYHSIQPPSLQWERDAKEVF